VTAPLFDVPAPPPGRVRVALDKRLEQLRRDGHEVPEDLAVVAQALATRLDTANAGGARNGYVMLSAEYRAARRDLLEGIAADDGGTDSLEAAIADFRAAQAGHAPQPG
jgi:hypothetical protein